MKARIAVVTVSGKAYYLIVNELKKKNLPFLSLTPKQPIPLEIYVVITTEEESSLIKHENVLVYKDEMEPGLLINEAVQIIQGKKRYERIVIGVDPGEVLGLAVLADGKVIETGNCFSPEETSKRIASILKLFKSSPTASVFVKIGDGVPKYRKKLLRVLDNALPSNVVFESVSEAGTNRYASETKHRRGLRDIVSAIKIAGRNGHRFSRRKKTDEPQS
jgi:hypothetical protein